MGKRKNKMVGVKYTHSNFLDAREYLRELFGDPNVKIKASAVPFNTRILLLDYKLEGRGIFEDINYASNTQYLNLVRRGNTIVTILPNPLDLTKVNLEDGGHKPVIKSLLDNKECQIYVGRKGLQKFFDLRKDYM